MKKIYLLILAVAIVSGCKKTKNEKPVTFPYVMASGSLEAESDIKLYSGGKEINDPAVKAKFAAENHLSDLEIELPQEQANLTFVSQDSVEFVSPSSRFGVSKQGDVWLFTSASLITENAGFPDEFFRSLAKYRSAIVPMPAGQQREKEVMAAYGNYSALKFPLFVYAFNTSGGSSGIGIAYARYQGLLLNEFNTEVISRLAETDTLAIKQYFLHFKPE